MRTEPCSTGSLTFRQLYPPPRSVGRDGFTLLYFPSAYDKNDIFRNIFHLPPRVRGCVYVNVYGKRDEERE